MRARRSASLLSILFAGVLAIGCGQDGAQTFELTGVVQTELDRAPIAGATVTFTSDTLESGTATSDEEGIYEMTISSDVRFGQVRAEKVGFLPAEATVYFDTPTRRADLFMRAE